MKSALLISMLIAILGVSFYLYEVGNRFDQNYFIKKSFNVDLGKYLDSYNYSEKNGLLIIQNVNKTDSLFKSLMSENIFSENKYMQATYFGEGIGNEDWGPTTYKTWESFDGFSKMTLYYEKSKILLIGYFNGFGG